MPLDFFRVFALAMHVVRDRRPEGDLGKSGMERLKGKVEGFVASANTRLHPWWQDNKWLFIKPLFAATLAEIDET